MKSIFFGLFLLITTIILARTPTDYLPKEFHKQCRDILGSKMPDSSVAIIFANPIRNRTNDIDYIFHQDPNFYYLTGFRESNTVLVLFSND